MSADKYPGIFSRQTETIVYIFSRQMEAIVFIFPSFVRSRDPFRPIARERKCLMDYKLGYLSADIICSEKRTACFPRT